MTIPYVTDPDTPPTADHKPTDPPVPVHEGFVWTGQPFTTCNHCQKPAWDHTGADIPADPDNPNGPRAFRPWQPGEVERLRVRTEQILGTATVARKP